MKKHFILGIMALAALVSCTKSEVLNQESLQEKGITFSAYVGKAKQTKATDLDYDSIKDAENLKGAGIGILAWRTGDLDATDPQAVAATAPSFMPNLRLSLGDEAESGLYSATYSPVRYWPSTGAKVSFYAYAPYATGTANLPEGVTAENNLYHPENITFNVDATTDAQVLSLNVPWAEQVENNGALEDATKIVYLNETDELSSSNGVTINTGKVYSTQTDFMVAKVGNGQPTTDAEGNTTGWTGYNDTENTNFVGINQNLTKSHEGAVTLQMKHALSKISFEAKAGNREAGLKYTDAKVVFDYIYLEGNFVGSGKYDLLNQKWTEVATTPTTVYGFVNEADPNVDAFNPIADELYNIATPSTGADETNEPDENGWYKLNKSSHNLMVIPVSDVTDPDNPTPAKISKIYVKYMVQTFENGEEKTDWRDNVYYVQDVNIDLEAGKHYIFRFNIELKEITFEIGIDEWSSAEPVNVEYPEN